MKSRFCTPPTLLLCHFPLSLHVSTPPHDPERVLQTQAKFFHHFHFHFRQCESIFRDLGWVFHSQSQRRVFLHTKAAVSPARLPSHAGRGALGTGWTASTDAPDPGLFQLRPFPAYLFASLQASRVLYAQYILIIIMWGSLQM